MPTKKPKKKPELEIPKPEYLKGCGNIYDKEGFLLGKYIYLKEGQQELFDKFFKAWIKTYHSNNNFFATLDIETNGLEEHLNEVLLISICTDGRRSLVFEPCDFDLTYFKKFLEVVPLHNTESFFDFKFLFQHYGVMPKFKSDAKYTAQMAYAGILRFFDLKSMVDKLLDKIKLDKEIRNDFALGIAKKGTYQNKHIEYAARDTIITHVLAHIIHSRMERENLLKVWEEIDRPVLEPLVYARNRGILADKKELKNVYDASLMRIKELYEKLNENVKELIKDTKFVMPKTGFNAMSHIQVASLLKALNIYVKNTKKETLEEYVGIHPIIDQIMEYRAEFNFASKFLKPLAETTQINPKTGRIHPNANLNGAVTGRLSYREPNIHSFNEKSRPILIADPGWKILSNDYSSYELRALAAYSKEEFLLNIFHERKNLLPLMKELSSKYNEFVVDDFVSKVMGGVLVTTSSEYDEIFKFANLDIHKMNAGLLFNVETQNVSKLERKVTKCVGLDTLVSTDVGLIRIGDLLPENPKPDTYYNVNLNVLQDTNTYEFAPQIYFAGKKPTYRITTLSGRTINCSELHKFRTFDDKGKYVWKQVNQLKQNDHLILRSGGCGAEQVTDLFKLLMYTMVNGSIDEKHSDTINFQFFKNQDAVGLDFVDPFDELIELLKSQSFNLKVKISKRNLSNSVTVQSKDFVEWLSDLTQNFTKLSSSTLSLVDRNAVEWLLTTFLGNNSNSIEHDSSDFLEQVQAFAFLLGVNLHLKLNGLGFKLTLSTYNSFLIEKISDPDLELKDYLYYLKVIMPNSMQEKIVNHTWANSAKNTTKEQALAICKEALTTKEFETLTFLDENRLTTDKIISIKFIGETDLCDLSVPTTNTLIYNGFVSHNTLSYAILYGAEIPRIYNSLIKEGIHYSLEQSKEIKEKFLKVLPSVDKFIKSVQEKVIAGEPVTTFLGRKRWFPLPPPWQKNFYKVQLAAAFREAVNSGLQGSNADAIKLSMGRLRQIYLSKYEEPYMPYDALNIHDELATNCPDQHLAEVSKIKEAVMVEAGEEALNFLCPVEVSSTVNQKWMK